MRKILFMKRFIVPLVACIILASCKKDKVHIPPPPEHPQMTYTDFQNFEIGQGTSKQFDIDGNGSIDFMFGTILIGDPILIRDRLQFLGLSAVSAYVLADPFNNSLVLNGGATIASAAPAGFGWFEVQDILLAEKITPMNGPVFWEGNWKDASHKYLPLQVRKDGQVYNGWIELSMNKATEKLILHKAAVSKEAGKNVKAGF